MAASTPSIKSAGPHSAQLALKLLFWATNGAASNMPAVRETGLGFSRVKEAKSELPETLNVGCDQSGVVLKSVAAISPSMTEGWIPFTAISR